MEIAVNKGAAAQLQGDGRSRLLVALLPLPADRAGIFSRCG